MALLADIQQVPIASRLSSLTTLALLGCSGARQPLLPRTRMSGRSRQRHRACIVGAMVQSIALAGLNL